MSRKLTLDDIMDVFENPSDSECSELDEDDYEDITVHVAEEDADEDTPAHVAEETIPDPEVLQEESVSDDQDHTDFSWIDGDLTAEIRPFVHYPTDKPDKLLSPLEYFRMLITSEMLELCVQQTNIYSAQKYGTCVNITTAELEHILGMYLRMGLAQMPSVRCYWETNMAYNRVSDIMSRNRFEKLLSSLHFSDNLSVTEVTKKEDKVWKIRPWLTMFSRACLKKTPERDQCVDEIMVPFKGRSSLRQYIQSKPTRWGFKLWARAGSSGYLYDFDVYQGAVSKIPKRVPGQGLGYNVVMKLTKALEDNHFFRVYADNFFTSYNVAETLLKRGIYYTGTIRAGRYKNCILPDEKQMKAKGRGTTASQIDITGNFTIVRWYDNKCVTLLSSLTGVEPKDMARRWDRNNKEHILVPRPSIVKMYNCNMGGVDLHDMLTTLYKYPLKSRRWYMYLFWHTITIAVANSWLMYREDCTAQSEKHISLRKFQANLASALIFAGQGKFKRGRPSIDVMSKKFKKPATTVAPVIESERQN